MGIDNKHPHYILRAPQWSRCRHTFDGQDAVKRAGTAYLPKLGDQSDDSYEAYLQRALFFGAVERTVSGLAGAVMRKAPVIEAPDKLKALFSDITGTGMSLNAFITWALMEQLLQGRIGILPDWDTKADRPILSGYAAEKIINWHFDDDKKWIVLQESYSTIDPEDEYNVIEAIQYRKLLLDGFYTQVIYRKTDQSKFVEHETIEPTTKGKPLVEIPIIVTNTAGLGYVSSEPPLLNLSDVNLSHYRTSADLEHGRHWTALPTAWVTGAEAGTKLVIGSGDAWIIPNENAKTGFLEYTGQGLKALENGMAEKSDMMAKLGAQLLSEKAGVEAYGTARLRQNAEASVLQSSVTITETSVEKSLNDMSEWMGLGRVVSVKLNNDFVNSTLSAQDLKEIVASWQTGGISHNTLLYNLQRGELLPPGVTVEDERALIAAEAPIVS